ncbi:MAG: hypothetical protein JWM94_120, partial [Sphingomonas bacterium]|nr:hypothetical protein [Sphingomonas bacterium]
MGERKRGLANGSAIAALLALAGMAGTPAVAAPPAAKKVAAKKVVTKKTAKKKVVRKATGKKAAKKTAPAPIFQPIIYAPPAPPAPAYFPPAPPAPSPYADPSLYRYIDDADALLDTVGTSPPDYGFRYDGIDCWAWQLSGGELMLAEPVGDHYRFYAFDGDAPYPFFVGDGAYSYGFAGRALAAVYGSDAHLVAWRPGDAIADGAQWLAERGRAMRASIRSRAPVVATDWADSMWYFGDLGQRFDSWRGQSDWSLYRTGPGARHRRDWRVRLGDESNQRRDRADRFDRWRRDGYRGAPPQNNGGWNTSPGTDPGRRPGAGQGPGQGGWTGRPRPAAPPTPFTPPA